VALLLFVVRFWKEAITNRPAAWGFLRRKFQWIQSLLGLPPSEVPNDNRIQQNGNQDANHNPTPVRRISVLPESSSNNSFYSLDGQRCSTDESFSINRVRNNQVLIKSVLLYWFGQHSPENSQKMLWMIAASSVELRTRVDQEITEKFESLLADLAATSSRRWTEWCHDRDGLYGYQGKIAAIIVLDQFSRHIQRRYCFLSNSSITSSPIPAQTTLDGLAFQTAQLFVEQHRNEIQCGMIPLPMNIFSLMPYRHASTLESVEFVQEYIEASTGMNEQMDAMLRRFRKATNRRMTVLQDDARRTGNKIGNTAMDDDSTAHKYIDEEILERVPFEADLTPALNHPLHKNIIHFLAELGIHPSRSEKDSLPETPVIVSLSGGVDSMAIAAVLAHLNRSCGYNLYVIAVHIDYANRPESGAEADFVGRYCNNIGITFRCRRINEVTRGVAARDDYERIARQMRYDSYREAIAVSQTETKAATVVGVFLGHHRGDLRENVLSNAHKGCGPLDLSGMTAVSKNDGVTIYRPFLTLEKSAIFDYARKFGVPYFKGKCAERNVKGSCQVWLSLVVLVDLALAACLLETFRKMSHQASSFFTSF
jgi:tRNA(Ile)-lysidine synthetase-like protein